jgi:hypothetical protein
MLHNTYTVGPIRHRLEAGLNRQISKVSTKKAEKSYIPLQCPVNRADFREYREEVPWRRNFS